VLFDVFRKSVLCLPLVYSGFLKEIQNGVLLITSGLRNLGFFTKPVKILNGIDEFLLSF
jgi:hypothetical protein